MVFAPPPVYNDPYGEFITAFKPLNEPGFFPVHSGRIPSEGPLQQARARVVIYGTDWGTSNYADECRKHAAAGRECDCQLSLRPASAGRRPSQTERNLFDALQRAEVDPATVVLTNAVLGLGPNQTGNERVFMKHPEYLRICGAYHGQWLERQQPRVALLMGAAHLETYGYSIWAGIWPELFGLGGVWCGLQLRDAYSTGRTIARAASGLLVQLTYHPSSGPHWWKVLQQTVEGLASGR